MSKGKIAMIGAGSVVFSQTLLNDMLATPALDGFEYALMSRTMPKIERLCSYSRELIKKHNLKSSIYATCDRRDALKGADYVVLIFGIGGRPAQKIDREVPLKYGVDQGVGDSIGPGGVFRFLRTVGVMRGIDDDMRELCPNAYVLNYVNPMGAICTYLGRATSMNAVGLCHGVQTTIELLAGYAGVPESEVDFTAAGINHMAWFLKLERHGVDLYPTLLSNIEKPAYYMSEKVRGEVMRHCGYFMTESSRHLSEYLPWFRKNEMALNLYCRDTESGAGAGAGSKEVGAASASSNAAPASGKGDGIAKFDRGNILAFNSGELEPRSKEYCTYIIEALETGKPFKFNGNVMNRGYIENLPATACVEVPIYADRQGFHPVRIGALPLPLAAMNQSNLWVQELMVEAAIRQDPEYVFWAVAMDPLTSAVLTLGQIREMVAEMLEAEAEWLPEFHGKTLKKTPDISIPPGTAPVPVPLDPALAIRRRFMQLSGQIK
ncbi:MAG: alpha-glucosidase/alpha-galactosidase [Oscillospiraceae bacterium]|nr:alpha-glucosidase/alpha-galactosidase [Oscillospiraceae bacterium]